MVNYTNTVVYFIVTADFSSIKIGYSANPHRRIRQLQTGNAKKLSFLGMVPGCLQSEAVLHSALEEYRVEGTNEWYTPDLPVLELIASLIAKK